MISVVIPAYNRAGTIRYCLDSVLQQTLTPLEVIVVDDRSTDETVEIVSGYPDPRVRCVVLEKNSGAQAARNRGIREAKGDWIAFQDSDDEWLPEKLEKQLQALKTADYDPWTVVHTNGFWFEVESGKKTVGDLPVVEGEDVYPLLLTTNGPLFPTMLVSRMALEKIGFLDENVPAYQEWDTAIRLAKLCRFIHLKEPLFIYRLHAGEMISKNVTRGLAGYDYIIEKFEEDIITVCGKPAWEKHLSLQAMKAMNSGLWDRAGSYLSRIESNSGKRRLLGVMLMLHLKPEYLYRLKLGRFL